MNRGLGWWWSFRSSRWLVVVASLRRRYCARLDLLVVSPWAASITWVSVPGRCSRQAIHGLAQVASRLAHGGRSGRDGAPHPFDPVRQFFTKVARCGPVNPFASARLLHALRDVCLTGVAFAPLGVAVVVGCGVSAARAVPPPRTATTARATGILMRASTEMLAVLALRARRSLHTLDGEPFRRHEGGIKKSSPSAQASLSRSMRA